MLLRPNNASPSFKHVAKQILEVQAVTRGGIVRLDALRPEHVTAEYVAWLNDPEVVKFTEIQGPETIESVCAYVAAAEKSPTVAMWRILIDDDRHVGNIRLSNIRTAHRRAEIALLVGDRTCWGCGVGTRAIELVSRYAFDELKLEKLTAGILEPNVGSRRAFEKAGYHCEAVLASHAVVGGCRCNSLLLVRFARESHS